MIFILLFILLCNSQENQTICFEDLDCSDDIWCNGKEKCINDLCVNGEKPCSYLSHKINEFKIKTGISNFQIVCHEKHHKCLLNYFCFNDNDCDDFFKCNGKEYCNLTTHKCENSDKDTCLLDEYCDEIENKCLKIKLEITTNNQSSKDIKITIIISLSIILLLIVFLFIIISIFVLKK